jgi:hypothetical protein
LKNSRFEISNIETLNLEENMSGQKTQKGVGGEG